MGQYLHVVQAYNNLWGMPLLHYIVREKGANTSVNHWHALCFSIHNDFNRNTVMSGIGGNEWNRWCVFGAIEDVIAVFINLY